jgi:hypothetical protein
MAAEGKVFINIPSINLHLKKHASVFSFTEEKEKEKEEEEEEIREGG